MNIIREYNVQRNNCIPLKEQYKFIKQYWGKRLLSIGVNKEDRKYITFSVRV